MCVLTYFGMYGFKFRAVCIHLCIHSTLHTTLHTLHVLHYTLHTATHTTLLHTTHYTPNTPYHTLHYTITHYYTRKCKSDTHTSEWVCVSHLSKLFKVLRRLRSVRCPRKQLLISSDHQPLHKGFAAAAAAYLTLNNFRPAGWCFEYSYRTADEQLQFAWWHQISIIRKGRDRTLMSRRRRVLEFLPRSVFGQLLV